MHEIFEDKIYKSLKHIEEASKWRSKPYEPAQEETDEMIVKKPKIKTKKLNKSEKKMK